MPTNHTITINNQTIAVGTPRSVVLSWTAVTPVNILAGQSLTSTTLHTDAPPSTFPTTGNDQINVTVQDEFGDTFPVTVTYTGKSGSSFTGCVAQNADPTFSTVKSPATPNYSGTVTVNRTGTTGLPWMNTLTSDSILTIAIQWSNDGGLTWNDAVSAPSVGGSLLDRNGNPLTQNVLTVSGLNPTANSAQVLCTAAGPSSIEVSGTIVVTSR